MPNDFLPPKICPLMSGPSGQGGTLLEDCTSRCALYDHGTCALLALLRREPAPPADAGEPADGCEHACRMWCRSYKPRVDRDALLRLAEDVDGAADDSGGFEPLAGMLRDIARCIREALGVADGR